MVGYGVEKNVIQGVQNEFIFPTNSYAYKKHRMLFMSSDSKRMYFCQL